MLRIIDRFVNSFYQVYSRWIPAGDPIDEAVIVTSILLWLNVMTIFRFVLFQFFHLEGSFGVLFAIAFIAIYVIMHQVYNTRKRFDKVLKSNSLFFDNLTASVVVLLLSILITVYLFLITIFYVVDSTAFGK